MTNNLQTTDNNCGKSLLACNADFAKIENIYKDLTCVANISLKELADKNRNLLVFPKTFSQEERYCLP